MPKWLSLGICVMIVACGAKNQKRQLVDFVNDPEKKITQKIKVGDVTATMRWMPANYRMLIDSLSTEDDQYNYFDVKFEKPGENKLSKEKTLYLDFDMQKNFVLAVDGDSLLPSICQRVQNGLNNSYEYMLAFENKNKNGIKDFTVVYKDEIFSIGTLAFVYKQADIKKIPMLTAK